MNYEDLNIIFNTAKAHWVRSQGGEIIGKGCLQDDLLEQGFTQKELKRLVRQHILKKYQVHLNGGVYNSYVIPVGGICEEREREI